MIAVMKFDGACPFLLCDETGPHTHPICLECGVIRFGNFFCPTCKEERPKWNISVSKRDYSADRDSE